jgi:chromosome condensin MukBEF ATPase and DNA-binding subunit MukB
MCLCLYTKDIRFHFLLSSLAYSQDKIGTANTIVVESIKTGEAKGYEHKDVIKPKSDAEIRCEQLATQLTEKNEENAALKKKIEELELKIAQLEGVAKPRQALQDAILKDSIVNGPAPE